METKIFKSINLIRCVSGANLNLFRYAAELGSGRGVVTVTSYGASDEHPMSIRSASDGDRRKAGIWKYAAMLLCVLVLGVGNAWANHSTHYGKAVLSNATGNGTVYLSTSASSNSGQSGSSNPGSKNGTSYITWNCSGSSGNDSKTYYARGTANNGYYWAGWANSADATSYTASSTGKSCSASGSSSSPSTTTIYGFFKEVTVGSPSPASKHFDATDNSVTCSDYSADISFTTTADAKADFKDPTWSSTGHGSFANTWSVADSKATFTVTFTGDGTYGGNVASGSRSRTSSTTLTLTSLPGNNSQSCTITASFPDIIVSEGSAEAMSTINTTPKTAEATFPVQWADDEEDFTAAFSEISGGGAWNVNSISYAATDAQSGTITVNYTFNPKAEVGNHSAKLTLSANANAGGASNYVVISAESEALASDDASVTYNNTTTKYGKLADAISAANSKPGAIVKLLRNIPVDDAHKITSPISVTGAMTLDLNSYTIEKTGLVDGNARVFDINMSNANSVFAITDSRTGGKIRGVGDNNNNLLTTVYVTKGVLSLASGEIECVNTNTGANAKATGIRTLADAKLLMTGGTVTATSSGAQARGVYPKTAPGTENYVVISGGTINVKGATQATGIDCESSSTDVDDPTKASVVLSGVTVNVETTGTTDAIAIRTAAGVSLGIQSGTYSAIAKTTTAYALQSSGYTAVLGGTFNATATTTTAHALRCEKGITAVKGGTFTATAEQKTAHGAYICDGAKLLTYGGTFKGVVNAMVVDGWATGTQVYDGGTLEAQGGTFIGEANNLSQSSEIAVCAAGIYLNNASKASYATISNATLQGKINNANLNGAANDTHRGAHGLMTRTTSPVTLTNCTISANTAHKYAFGIRSTNTSVELKNCAVTVNSSKDYNYGIYTFGTAKVEAYSTTITCISQTLRAYGAYIANGSLTAQDCDFTVKTLQTASTAAENSYLRGIYVASGKSATLNGCTVTAQGSATYSKEGYGLYIDGSIDVDNCTVTVSDINTGAYAIYNSANTTKIGVASGKFKATATTTGVSTNGTAAAAKQQLYGGYYNTNTNLSKYLPAGYGIETLPSTSTEYGEGYRYAIRATEDVGDPVCKIGATPYTTLEEALEYASKNATSSNKLTILMVKDYTLKAGDYTLPAYTTLIIPRSGQTSFEEHPSRSYNTYAVNSVTCNLKLTFASGAHMDVLGTIQTGAKQSAKGQTDGFNGMPEGAYGWLYMNEGSTISLENGSKLYSWGYVTGAGTIDAKRGSTVYEFIQIKDWRGGSATSSWSYYNSNGAFPFNQFYIQNIECPITFRPGSAEICDGTVNASSSPQTFNDVAFIGKNGSGSLFMMADEDMSEDTWVRKRYDAVHDKQVYELNSAASIGSITVYGVSSSSFVLPLPNNMHIHLLSGEMHITENTELLPGAIIEIDKEATGYIDANKSLYVFDINDWIAFTGTTHTYRLGYSPSWAGSGKTCPRSATITEDASVNVHGTLVVNGNFYTTGSGGGANVYSSNKDAGTITYGKAAPTSAATVYVNNTTKASSMTGKTANPAWLQNEDGTHKETSGTVANKSWIYYDSKWNCWEERNCFGYDEQDHPYAKPAAWVQLTSNVADATDHLFRDAATGNRRFLLDECTWWEVEPTPYDGNKYKCMNADHNGKYKYYEYVGGKWQEAVVTVTWKNGDATIATYSKTLYGTRPTYLEANPTKAKTTSEYYTWTGWTKGSTDGEFFAKNAELPVATENTTYYAYFETHKFEYTISFKNYDEAVLEAKRWAHGEVPTYEGTPLKPATAAKEYTHDGWSTTKNGSKVTIPAATAAATYYAHFAESDRKYTIQWVNYDGTVLKEEQVAYNTTPTEPVTPTRPNDTYYTYTFDSWSPAVGVVSGNQTYTATYNYEKKVNKYEVSFKNGSTTIFSQNLVENSVPVFDGNEPTKDPTAQYSYTFDGWSTTNGGALAYAKNAALPALTADVTYYAHFAQTTNTYKVLWKSEDGKQLLETDAAVTYNATPEFNSTTPTKANLGTTLYQFDGWSATVGGAKLSTLPAVTEDKVFYAHFSVAVASVTAGENTTYHTTVADAFTAANGKTNAVVTMLQNASVESEVEITAAMTIDLNDKTISSAVTTAATGVFKINAPGKTVTITDNGPDGKISHIANCAGYVYGINLFAGSLNVEGGYIYAENTNTTAASGNRACGIMYANDYTNPASLTVSDGTIEAKRASTYVYGISIYTGYCGLTMTGGTVKAIGSGTVRGIYTQGTAVLSNVTVTATAALTGTANCYAVFSDKDGKYTINSGTYTATSTSTGTNAYALSLTKSTSSAGGSAIVNGGRFSGKSKELNISNGTITLQGGYYVHNTELEAKCADNYHVLPNADATYEYKVAEAYTVTFNANGHGTAPASQLIEKGQKASQPTAPSATGYTFGGWYKEAGCKNEWDFASDVVTAATPLYAKLDSEYSQVSMEL